MAPKIDSVGPEFRVGTSHMNYQYIALLVAILLVVFLLARWVVKAQRRYGRAAAWGVILVEAVAVGALMFAAAKYFPDLAQTWVGEQLMLALVGIGLSIFIGGGLVMALGRR
jgi:uncharacterized membrane protein YwaF